MRFLILFFLPFFLTACAGDDGAKPATNNYTIDVVRQTDGTLKAMAPPCKPWDEESISRLENDPLPQLGCATKGNLAKQIVNPEDLVLDQLPARMEPKSDGETLATGVKRYHENQVYQPDTAGTSGATGQ